MSTGRPAARLRLTPDLPCAAAADRDGSLWPFRWVEGRLAEEVETGIVCPQKASGYGKLRVGADVLIGPVLDLHAPLCQGERGAGRPAPPWARPPTRLSYRGKTRF